MLVIIFIINLIFFQTFIKDNMFYLLTFNVLLQVVSLEHEMFGPINNGFGNNTIHENQDPINHFSFYPINITTKCGCSSLVPVH